MQGLGVGSGNIAIFYCDNIILKVASNSYKAQPDPSCPMHACLGLAIISSSTSTKYLHKYTRMSPLPLKLMWLPMAKTARTNSGAFRIQAG